MALASGHHTFFTALARLVVPSVIPGKIISKMSSLLRPLYEFVYPPTCFACNKRISEDGRICLSCTSSMKVLTIDDHVYKQKLQLLTSHGDISGLASAFHFEKDGTLQTLVHHLKYDDMPELGVELGNFVAVALTSMIGSDIGKHDAVLGLTPVPLHPTKERERGYNQSEFICRGIERALGLRVFPSLLKRIRNTRTQTQLNAQERRENVSGAFAFNPRFASLVAGSTIFVVDDIITTGATITECAKVLKASGAKKVYALSVGIPDHTHLP